MPSKLLFLPGASGNTQFWLPVAQRLAHPAEKVHIGWPGFGSTPADSKIQGLDDLAARVAVNIQAPTALIAQSMGGVIAVLAALQKPQLISHLVLSVTSGGMDMASFGAEDWRPAFFAANPAVPRWFGAYQQDLTPQLARLRIPTLLLWGDADPISPVAVGQRLAALLPCAQLHVFPGGDHNLGSRFACDIAPLIDKHLSRVP
jgi:pimeloyl-ACP methyl ester carboxylesterase